MFLQKAPGDDFTITGKVTFNTTNVTINIDTDLSLSTGYYILITNGVIEDISGNAFAGITNSAQWSFTAEAASDGVGVSPLSRKARNRAIAMIQRIAMTL